MAESPYTLRVLPSRPCWRWCTVAGGGRAAADPGALARFEIQLRDEFGNRCRGPGLAGKLPLEARLEGPGGSGTVAVAVDGPGDDGRILCSYEAPRRPGYYRLHLESGGAPLPRTPYSVKVAPSGGGHAQLGAAAGGTIEVVCGIVAVAFGAANVVGGFVVTDRMLQMFKRRPEPKDGGAE